MNIFSSFVFVFLVLGITNAINSPQELFQEFISKYNRNYKSNAEYQMRYLSFVKNLEKSKQMQETEKGSAIYGINKFSDFTEKEFRSLVGLSVPLKSNSNIPKPSPWPKDVPTSFDWREKNAVTEVKDQDPCGNCWAFSTVGNIEGLYAIKYGNLISFSEQELTDCDKIDGGCIGGGWPYSAYEALINIGGLETEKEYPYWGHDDYCKFNASKAVVQLSGGLNLTNDETQLAVWLAQNGPVSVGVNYEFWNTYVSGIINNAACKGGFSINHAVTLVGYGTENDLDYWIIKNSYGTNWGEEGYFRLARGVDMCGVAEVPTSAIIV